MLDAQKNVLGTVRLNSKQIPHNLKDIILKKGEKCGVVQPQNHGGKATIQGACSHSVPNSLQY
jgi:hypothetical protein